MLNSILETRIRDKDIYRLTLRINEEEYFSIYDSLDEVDAAGLLVNYLKYRSDDGRPEIYRLKHNKNEHMVIIEADLYYADNEKTQEADQGGVRLKQ